MLLKCILECQLPSMATRPLEILSDTLLGISSLLSVAQSSEQQRVLKMLYFAQSSENAVLLHHRTFLFILVFSI